MKTFHIDCELNYDVSQQTLFVFNLAIPSDANQRICRESLTVEPKSRLDEFADVATGNRFSRVDVSPGSFNIRYLATVDLNEPAADLSAPEIPLTAIPGDVWPYILPSKYCEADQLFHFAVQQFGHLARGYSRVEAICQWIRDNIEYKIGTSSPLTTAKDVLANRAGVCRDFAHLAITFCRALNIPARFVTGYARYSDPPPDFHAVFEAYLGDRWYLFDPTQLSPLSEIVKIGMGKDASEVAFATFFGVARMRRLSPLIEPLLSTTRPRDSYLAELQTPSSGILLAA